MFCQFHCSIYFFYFSQILVTLINQMLDDFQRHVDNNNTNYHFRDRSSFRLMLKYCFELTKRPTQTPIWSFFYKILTNSSYFQVDFGRTFTIMAIVTKGLNLSSLIEYVKKYRVTYSNTDSYWNTVQYDTTNVSQCISIYIDII